MSATNDNNIADGHTPDVSLDVAMLLSELGLSAATDATTSPPSQYLGSDSAQTTLLPQQLPVDAETYTASSMMTPDTYYPMFPQPYYDPPPMQFIPAVPYHMPVSMTPQAPVPDPVPTTSRTITFATPLAPATVSSGQSMIMASPTGGVDGGPLSVSRQHQLSRSNSRSSINTSLSRTNSRGSGGGGGRTSYIRSRTSSYSSGSVTLYSDNKTHRCFIPGCYATFSRRRDMIRHLIFSIHSPLEKSFKYICDHCGKEYTRKDSLRRHQMKKHPELFPPSSSTVRGEAALTAAAAAASSSAAAL